MLRLIEKKKIVAMMMLCIVLQAQQRHREKERGKLTMNGCTKKKEKRMNKLTLTYNNQIDTYF